MIVTTLTRLKRQVRWPYRRLCEYLALPYASFRRWKRRLERGQPAIFKPGPQKVAPLKLEELRVHLCRLKHGHQRSRGRDGSERRQDTAISVDHRSDSGRAAEDAGQHHEGD